MWERLSLPIEAVTARAPIHPKRPYGLTRPVVPPDGSFVSGAYFGRQPRRCPANCQLSYLADCGPRMLRCGPTAARAENPATLRLSVDCMASDRAAWLDNEKFSTKYRLSRLIDLSRCVRVRFSPYGLVHDTSLDVARGRDIVARWCDLAENGSNTSPNCSRPAAGAAFTANRPFSRTSRKPKPRSKPGAICRYARLR